MAYRRVNVLEDGWFRPESIPVCDECGLESEDVGDPEGLLGWMYCPDCRERAILKGLIEEEDDEGLRLVGAAHTEPDGAGYHHPGLDVYAGRMAQDAETA